MISRVTAKAQCEFIGSPQHIAMALFASEAGISLTHVPYKGATQAAVGVAGGEVAVAFQGLATVNSLIKGNRAKLLAVSTPKRMPQYPEAPTVSESGLPGFEFNSWFAVLAPAGTPTSRPSSCPKTAAPSIVGLSKLLRR